MGAYSFKKQFVPYVEEGSKTHTIRGKRKHPDRPGSTFYGFYAMRTKQCRKLIQAPILRVQDFRMERARVWIDGVELDLSERGMLAWRDGFRLLDGKEIPIEACRWSFELMLEFWVKEYGSTDFQGDIIYWGFDKRLKLPEAARV